MPLNKLHLPMWLTWVRIMLIPCLVGVYFLPEHVMSQNMQNWCAALIFTVGALTDALDGFLARRWQQTTAFGAFLDPVADKLMVCAAIIMLLDLSRISPVIALVMIGREITISALREWMANIGASKSVAVNQLGKLKTIAQMLAIPMLLLNQTVLGISLHLLGSVCMDIAALLTLWSMCYYLYKAVPLFQIGK